MISGYSVRPRRNGLAVIRVGGGTVYRRDQSVAVSEL
ncbi:hypothetical protein MT49_3214 [Mycobacterium tuberculosis 49-02]|nr:hypothetical protein MT49_3214 [Mycobacterium tuberculosis 49-02]